MNILIIEDDLFLSEKMVSAFQKINCINLVSAIDSMDTFSTLYSTIEIYDIVLVDLEIPPYTKRDHGYEIIDQIHQKNPNISIIVFSGKNDIENIRKAFLSGAIDYIIKPIRMKELEIRMLHIFHSKKHQKKSDLGIREYHGLRYNCETHTFFYKNIAVPLSKKLKYILLVFLTSPEKIIKNTELVEKIWGEYEKDFSTKIGVSIYRLRKYLLPFGISNWIQNSPGEGYMLMKQNYDSNL